MENPILAEGATFGDVIAPEATETETVTPEAAEPKDEGATDGSATSETPPETLGILKDEEDEKGDEDKPDLSLDADLEKHPVLRAKWEAFKSQKEKGIQQFIEKEREKTTELEGYKAQNEPIVEFYNQFENPDTVDDAYARMCGTLAKTYGRPFGGYVGMDANHNPVKGESTTTEASATEGEEEYSSDNKVIEKAAKALLPQIEQLLDKRLGPIAKEYQSNQAEREALSKATQALPNLKAEFEISAEPWITPEKVAEAVKAYPTLEPRTAFAAHFVKEIAKYTAKHSPSTQTVRNLPTNDSGGKTRADLREGSDFATIVASEATL